MERENKRMVNQVVNQETENNFAQILVEVRQWQRDWDNHPIGERGTKLKTADELIQELSSKYNVTKK